MNNKKYAVTFRHSARPDELHYYKRDAMHQLGMKLGELLQSGERFTVKMQCDEPPSWEIARYSEVYYQEPPAYTYWLEIGKVHEREVSFAVLPQVPVGLPPTSIKATPGRELLAELARRTFVWTSYFTAQAREQEIKQFNEWFSNGGF